MKVAAATLNQTPLDWDGNERRITEMLARARAEGVSILCLPELCISGYGCEDAFLSPAVRATALEVLASLVPDTRGLVVCFGLPLAHQKGIYNVCALCVDGKLCGFVAKRALAGDGIHYEPRWFKPWPAGRVRRRACSAKSCRSATSSSIVAACASASRSARTPGWPSDAARRFRSPAWT